MRQIALLIKARKWKQAEAASHCGVTQPRINDLLRGRVSRFSLDALVNIATELGSRVHVELEAACGIRDGDDCLLRLGTEDRGGIVFIEGYNFAQHRFLQRGGQDVSTFNIYTGPMGSIEAVKQGWSWPAFLFGPIWALVARLWVIGIILLPVEIISDLMANAVSAPRNIYSETSDIASGFLLVILAAWLCERVIFGVYGNLWKESRLTRLGFVHTMTTNANGRDEAIGLNSPSQQPPTHGFGPSQGWKQPAEAVEQLPYPLPSTRNPPSTSSLRGPARWYRSLTDGQRSLLWISSAVLVLFYGVGLILLLFLLYLHLGDRGI